MNLGRRRSGRLAFALILAGLVVVPGTASAEFKPFRVAISPETVSGGTNKTFEVTLHNDSKQNLGSVNLTAPVPITVGAAKVLATSGTADVKSAGKLIELRSLPLPPGGELVVSLSKVSVDCGDARAFNWAADGKQANDYRGLPGNNFTLNSGSSSLTTELVGGGECTLPPVECKEDSIGSESCQGTLRFHGAGVTASPTQSVNYTLTFTVAAVPVTEGNAGSLDLKLIDPSSTTGHIDCVDHNERVEVTGQSEFVSAAAVNPRKKLVTWQLDYENPTAALQARGTPPPFCFRGPYPFFTTSPDPLEFPDTNGQFEGVMPDCVLAAGLPSLAGAQPCVTRRAIVDLDTDVIEAEVPARLPDPYYR